MSLINEYNSRLNIKDSTNPEKQVAEFINFLPVLCFSEDGMNQLKATELIDMALSGIASTMLAKKWQSPLMVNVTDTMLERLLANPELLKSLEQIEAFRNLNTEITQIISSEKALKKLKKAEAIKSDKDLPEKEKKEKKENTSVRNAIREKLLKFITMVPIFMYLTDHREVCLKDVIINLEPQLFELTTGLAIKDFELLCEIGVFNQEFLNASIFAFKRYEEPSLDYLGTKPNAPRDTDTIGGFDMTMERGDIQKNTDGFLKN